MAAVKEKLWTKDFISITTISFFIFTAFYILLTALPLYLVGNLHVGTDKVGLVVTLFLGAAIIIRPLAGKWVSNGSQKKILVYSSIAFFIATIIYPFATNIWTLLILRIFHGITFGIITTVKGTICAELIPAKRRGEGLSYFSLAMTLAMVIGPYIGLNLANIGAYTLTFILAMLISAINIVLSLFMKIPEQPKMEKQGQDKKFDLNDIVDKKAAPLALCIFLMAVAYSGVSAFISLYAKELHLVSAASLFLIMYAVFMLIFRPFTGRWSDQFGSKIIIYPCLILFTIGMFMLSQVHIGAIMVISGAIIGIGYGSITPILQTQIINSVEPHRVGIANSLFFNSMDLGMAIGAYVLGIVANGFGYRTIYFIGALLVIVTGLWYYVQAKAAQASTSRVLEQNVEINE